MNRQPTHPGIILNEMYLKDLGISQEAFSKKIGVSFRSVNQLINAKRGVSVEMALRLSKALGTTPQLWLNLQNQYDLFKAQALKSGAINLITPIKSKLAVRL
ncbi:addiction module antidote protein, HigA family [Helicobacter sp. 12S02232-10]|uniref:HigA family addiction module antitoxin n=1 Tax=Helicobacter sp. 12S02232-10 TaxID=1476197 RepID=UPI000BA73D62|nr:HigA family addiction module antitoxin [Helicobacter sp. 12S02232-10]PAF49078.1 addiction module antidote protein, HigA family [Helicobacter sp. 12S02232-10]